MKLKIFLSFLLWRVLLFAPLFFGEKILSYHTGYDYTNIWKFVRPYPPVDNFLIFPWANFDGVHYLLIAGNGYTNNFQFFPLFPTLIKALSFLSGEAQTMGGVSFFSGLLIANVLFVGSLIFFYKLIRLDYSPEITRSCILFLFLFPASFYFGSIYSESLFLFLTLLSFYFARKRLWLLSGICGFLLSITRIVGVLILPALIYEFIKQEKNIKPKYLLKSFPLLLTPLGILIYSYFNFVKTGDFLYFLKAHELLGNGRTAAVILFPQTIFRYFKILFSFPVNQFEWWISLLELITFFAVSILLYIAWRKKVRASYFIFGALCFFLPVFSGTFSGLPRYSLVIFPIFISLALINNKIIKISFILIFSILLFLLLMFFSKGYFIA